MIILKKIAGILKNLYSRAKAIKTANTCNEGVDALCGDGQRVFHRKAIPVHGAFRRETGKEKSRRRVSPLADTS